MNFFLKHGAKAKCAITKLNKMCVLLNEIVISKSQNWVPDFSEICLFAYWSSWLTSILPMVLQQSFYAFFFFKYNYQRCHRVLKEDDHIYKARKEKASMWITSFACSAHTSSGHTRPGFKFYCHYEKCLLVSLSFVPAPCKNPFSEPSLFWLT